LHDAWQEFGWLLILGSGAFLPALRHNASPKLRQFAAFTLLYLAAAVAIGTFASGGKGVDRNAFFDALIAATLAVAALTSYLREQVQLTARRTAPLVGMTLIAATCGATWAWAAVQRIPSQWHDIQQADRREAETVTLVRTIRDLGPDSTACEQLALCYWAHAQFKIDFFNFGQKLATGALAPETCRRVFSSDSVRLIQSSTASGARATISKYLPGRCNEELTQAYVPIASSANGTIFRPGSATDEDSSTP